MRRKDREIKDLGAIREIVEKAKILRLGLFDGAYPYIVPLHYGFRLEDGVFTFYMHGAREGHKLDLVRQNPHVGIELDTDIELVPASTPCGYSSTYASLIGRGLASCLEDVAEKIEALQLLMENQTGEHFIITEAMAVSSAVIKVVLPEYTAKSRPKR